MRHPRPQPWLPGFVALSAIWGASFLFIKVADRALSPAGVALARVAIGALTLLSVLAAQRLPLPRGGRTWAHLAVVALVGNALPFTLIAYGETEISSVLAGIWNATTPLLTMLIAIVVLNEQPTRTRTLGLAIGFAGVVCLLGPWSGVSGGALLGDLACLASAALYGVAFTYTRRYLSPLEVPAGSLAAGQLMCASAELALLALVIGGGGVGHVTVAVLGSVVALGALGTGIAFVLSYELIERAGATTASTVTYVIPLFATVLGIAVLGERLTWNEPLGAVIVLLGVAVSQDRLPSLVRVLAGGRRPAPTEPAG